MPAGFASNDQDCDDSDDTLNLDDSDSDGYSTCDDDCDDSDDSLSPMDADSDGYSTCDGDCDDSDDSLNLDDSDSDGYSTCDGDCDDSDDSLNLDDLDGDGYSLCDEDCDDSDESLNLDDSDSDGYSTCDDDCDDTDSLYHPGSIDGLFTDYTCDDEVTAPLDLADYVFVGENADDEAGYSVSFAGDVNGDGLEDILIGAWGNDDVDAQAGKVYLIFSSSLGSSTNIDLSLADYVFLGQNQGDQAGISVAGAGDIDGDGLDDILIGAWGYDTSSHLVAGRAYIILASSLGSTTTIGLGSADYHLTGVGEFHALGHSVASAGDVDGDGLADVLIGAPNKYGTSLHATSGSSVYFLFGKDIIASSSASLSYSHRFTDYYCYTHASCTTTWGTSGLSHLGWSVSSAGDIDGDGRDDIIMGAPEWKDSTGSVSSGSGRIFIVFGKNMGRGGGYSVPTGAHYIDTVADITLVGNTSSGFYSGRNIGGFVTTVGDIDGDGLDDILQISNDDIEHSHSFGGSHIILGSTLSTTGVHDFSDVIDFEFDDLVKKWEFSSGSTTADIDQDGIDDLIIGTGHDTGQTSVILSSELGTSSTIDLSAGDAAYQFDGESSADWSGENIAGGRDVNGDGLPDILIGASGNDDGGSDAGKVYLIFGQE